VVPSLAGNGGMSVDRGVEDLAKREAQAPSRIDTGSAGETLPSPDRQAVSLGQRLLDSPLALLLTRLVVVAALLLLWELVPARPALRLWLSSPSQIFQTLAGWIAEGSVWGHLGATLQAMLIGYVIGCGAGVGLGFVFGLMPRTYLVISPCISALYALPKVALVPLFILVLGIGIASKVALVALTVFFIVLNSTIDGVRDVDVDLTRVLTLMGASRLEIVAKVLMPATLAWIFTGMRISVRYAFTGTLLAELIGSNRGLGYLIEYNTGIFNATGAYAAVFIIVVVSVGMSEALIRLEKILPRVRR
jgi:NitT/TauT family transport system permease protein